MFDSPAVAADALAQWFEPPLAQAVAEGLVPALVLYPSTAAPAKGATRLGGTPDAPEGFVWPRPTEAIDANEAAKLSHPDTAKELREHLARKLPFAFMAQIDLAEAARLGSVAASLPDQGRLLFFYDNAIGPWDTGTRTAKVLWDRSPREALQTVPMPPDLAEAARADREQMASVEAEFGEQAADGDERGSVYGAPARAKTLQLSYRLPDPASVEFERLPADLLAGSQDLSGQGPAARLFNRYTKAMQKHHDQYPEESWRRQQLLGAPLPEQDDPRYGAVVVTGWQQQHLSREQWQAHRDEIMRRAHDWVLLLQVDMKDWMQAPYVEGSVYFVIQRDDLAQRRFDKVVAVYQQT